MINLSKRLSMVAKYVDDHSKIIDIGCDHALLDIYLVSNRKGLKVIASDVNENALNQAKSNINKYQLNDQIITRLGNGLEVVEKDEIDTIIISGLGAHKIVGILFNNIDKLINVNKIIIQSNTNPYFLRSKITKLGYYIESEELIKENTIIYSIIVFKKGHHKYSKKDLYFGPLLLKENSALFKEKKQDDLKKLLILNKAIPKKYWFQKIKLYFQIKLFK